jgi:hypothetical protein
MVMDLSDSEILNDTPTSKGKELDNFMLKYNMLTLEDVKNAFQVTCKDILEILSQAIPCVGCRRRYNNNVYIFTRADGRCGVKIQL